MGATVIVPARGGSKGVPGKNLKMLAGKPLIQWTLEAALKAEHVDDVVVSTDDDDLCHVSKQVGASVPYLRPAHLAKDDVHAVHVILHHVDWLKQQGRPMPSAIMMLLPTSPLRRSWHIDEAMETFFEAPEKPVISVYRSLTPLISLRWIETDALTPVFPVEDPNMQRQNLKPVFGVNGSIYIASPDRLQQDMTFHTSDARPYVMDRLHSLDINSLDDFTMAEKLLSSPDFNLDENFLSGDVLV